MSRSFHLILLMTWSLLFPAHLNAQAPATATNNTCIVCGKSPLTGKIWKHKLGLVCDDCYNLSERCSICGLPAKDNYVKTGDGRVICRREAARALLKEDDAITMFENARRAVLQMTANAMALQQTNISTKMFDIDYWNYQNGKPLPPQLRRTGFSQSRHVGEQWTHNVILLSGQLKDDGPAVCAHEYTHLWINENRPPERTIEFESLEAVCELVAYKLAEANADEATKTKIRENPYTSGRIDTLVAAEARFGLNTILEWVRSGKEQTVTDSELAQLRVPSTFAARATPGPRTIVPAAVYVPPPPPSKLQLRGLLGSGSKRLALINGTTFAKGEEARLKLESGTVKVRCVDILESSVIVTVDGGEKQTLDLNGP